MTEVSTDQVKQAVESQLGGTSTFAQVVPIREMHGEQLVVQGTVHIFDLADHPGAIRANAWSHEMPDGKRRMSAVLHAGPITSPREAVRAAAIVAEQRATR